MNNCCMHTARNGVRILPDFREVRLSDKKLFDGFLKPAEVQASEYNFTNIFMWRDYYKFRFAVIESFLCIVAAPEGEEAFALFPIGKGHDEELRDVLLALIDYFESRGKRFVMKRVPKEQKTFFEKYFPHAEIEDDRDNDDYVYLSKDLIRLEGKKYDGKRNHIKKFKKLYNYEYLPITHDLIDDCIRVEEEWCIAKNCDEDPSILREKNAVLEALRHYSDLGFKGGALKINGRVEAFTLGEKLNSNTAVIHVEKANSQFEGSYTFINQQFCEREWADVEFVNREQDLGIPGIRKAKLSYHPVKMIEKIIVRI